MQPLGFIAFASLLTISVEYQGQLLQSFRGEVFAGNYTYYQLYKPSGPLKFYLHTITGDADLYVSDKTTTPTFEDFEFQASSCGDDSITISSDFGRPVGIGIYGHPSREKSTFMFSVLTIEEDITYEKLHQMFNKDYENLGTQKQIKGQSPSPYQENNYSQEEEEESLIWTVFVTILKLIFEILSG